MAPASPPSLKGFPAGLVVDPDVIAAELARRRLGFGRGPRMKLERDELEILGRRSLWTDAGRSRVGPHPEYRVGQVERGDVTAAG